MSEYIVPAWIFWMMIICSFLIAVFGLIQYYYDQQTINHLNQKLQELSKFGVIPLNVT